LSLRKFTLIRQRRSEQYNCLEFGSKEWCSMGSYELQALQKKPARDTKKWIQLGGLA
jgi:hypothetical protein